MKMELRIIIRIAFLVILKECPCHHTIGAKERVAIKKRQNIIMGALP